jgi:signal peptidase I
MEERLLFIGLSLGAYAWVSRRWQNEGGMRTQLSSAAWHGLFYWIAGLSISMILSMVFESRARVVSVAAHALRLGDIAPCLAIGFVVGAIGFWRAWSKGQSVESRRFFLQDDLEWADTVFSSALLAWLLMSFVVQAFKIPSGSMEKTLLIGDHLFVSKFVYGLKIPFTDKRILPLKPVSRGDIMVFEFPVTDPRESHCGKVNAGENFIKRVIGLPGETIQITRGRVLIDGKLFAEEPYAQYDGPYRIPKSVAADQLTPEVYQQLWQNHRLDNELGEAVRDEMGPVKVPEDAYFMMGDNRDHSCDSRYWGPVEKRFVKGKAMFIYWPPSRMKSAR